MQNSKYMLGNKFDKLHFHAKSQVKRKTTTKNKSSSSLKIRSFRVQNWKFKRLYFYINSKIKSTKYHTIMQNFRLKIKKKYKINYDTSLKSYDHANFKSGAWKHI